MTTGDRGDTFLLSGERVAKDCLRIEACGLLDELVAALGVARAVAPPPDLRRELLALQRTLFVLGAELSATPGSRRPLRRRMDARRVQVLNARCRALESQLPAPRGFIIPGAAPVEAHLHLARAVARRCECRVVALARRNEMTNPHLLAWLNRLSYVLWLLARPAGASARPVGPKRTSAHRPGKSGS
ncbi:MAG: cob(I)yrinic acid a,c-diamide adenosyltransferase [Kiritimatiellaeota bacterium]|nr:cob(I)yrinic acid a,c-diamide adenosyltransferase [Kiritimatiellota bacterium]